MNFMMHYMCLAKRRKGEDKRTEEEPKVETEADREYRLAMETNKGIDEDNFTRENRCKELVFLSRANIYRRLSR